MNTEAEAVAELARQNEKATQISVGEEGPWAIRTDEDERWVTFDPAALAPEPRRSRGVILAHDAESFATVVGQRGLPGIEPVLYTDEDKMSLVAVLNDDHNGTPGYRDYRVSLQLRRTPEWDRWANNEGLHSQTDFAVHVEDSVGDFIEPSQADMLALAQTFSADTKGRFKAGSNLDNGARQLTFEEEVEAKAGADGAITIPRSMRLGLRPFYGSVARDDNGEWRQTRFTVEALFKFTIREGILKIGYKLVQPEEVRRAAYRNLVEQVSELLGVTALAAPAPDLVVPPPLTDG